MSLIYTPQQLTEAQRAKISAKQVYDQLKQQLKIQFELAWKKRAAQGLVNKTQAEAQAFWNEMGTAGVAAMARHAEGQTLLYNLDNTYVPLTPPYEYVENQDGTITVGDLIV
jgi:hypothetical protein